MIRYKTKEDIVTLRAGGKIIASILEELSSITEVGFSTMVYHDKTIELCEKYNVKPVFLGYTPVGAKRAYPGAVCISINNEIVHGIPNEKPRILKDGDIVSIDMGIVYQNMILDSAITVGVGQIDETAQKLINVTKDALYVGITKAVAGGRLGDIGAAIEQVALKAGFSVAEDLCGHGVGYAVHEDPYVPNIGRAGTGIRLEPGLVIAIEPMFCEKKGKIKVLNDGYTIVTKDGGRAAHFEHTIAITEEGPVILSGK